MFGFMVTADGGLTTAGYVITVIAGIILFFLAIYFAGKNSDKKKLTTRQLVFCAVSYCTCFYYVLSENLQTALGRKRHSLQYAFYCSDRKLVWGWNRYYGWVCLRNPAVYPGALYTFIFSGML